MSKDLKHYIVRATCGETYVSSSATSAIDQFMADHPGYSVTAITCEGYERATHYVLGDCRTCFKPVLDFDVFFTDRDGQYYHDRCLLGGNE